ncbi:ATP-dependent helicase [Saccharophagus sp. K07]|uniref:ATP-dependent helicase n=1 Tax=Saccharophagus sp. K07 TaxID=2283636 RepID=UPI0016526A65|nr:ATP-dependent helicase [Saccharophagus sp. K07]MBC6903990.1 ATP-dependent helicase [Saccharophagus sp. K07]
MPVTPKLTDEQIRAASHRHGHARIVAVAGAGKTATLTHYLTRRLVEGAAPDRILVLMYNRAAQQAFQSRLSQQAKGPLPRVRTFHSLGLRLYQNLIQTGWLPPIQLQPMNESAVELQLKQLLQLHMPAAEKDDDRLADWLQLALELLQRVKSDFREPKDVFAEHVPLGGEFLAEVIAGFESWRRAQKLITFDDMLYEPARLFHLQPESQTAFRDRLDEILVDEYQDINAVQHFLLRVLAGERARVMVIGDPDQTIYEFRGSSPDFITHTFARDFPASANYQLSRTFRFGHTIALAANHLISHNAGRDPVLTISAPGTPATRLNYAATNDHGGKIADTIAKLRANGGAYKGMAVLCRLWSYARPVELELMARGIPYRMDGEQSILQCREIRPFWHCLDILTGSFFARPAQQKEQILFDLLTIPSWKIPHPLLRALARAWAQSDNHQLARSLESCLPAELSPFQRRCLQQMANALDALMRPQACPRQLLAYAHAIDYQERLRKTAINETQGQEHAGTVEAFLRFLLHLRIDAAADLLAYLIELQNRHQQVPENAVTLTTIHRSKGLEWPVVFLPNLAEGHLPCLTGRESDPIRALESERRLLYVALTRVQKQLFITLPDTAADSSLTTSRFFSEMRADLSIALGKALEQKQDSLSLPYPLSNISQRYLEILGNPLAVAIVKPEIEQTDRQWQTGQRVHHAILGSGEIHALDPQRIHIRFADGKVRVFASDLAEPHLTPLN